jgi:hypothetical protein
VVVMPDSVVVVMPDSVVVVMPDLATASATAAMALEL